MGTCQNWENIKTLNLYNSKTRAHKLMKLGTLKDGNKLYSIIKWKSQLTLYKRVIQKFTNFKDILKCCPKGSDPISFNLIAAHYLVYNSEEIGSEPLGQYIENWHCLQNLGQAICPTLLSYISLDSARWVELNDTPLDLWPFSP